MITQELLSYVRSELNKGKTREAIESALLSGGGWTTQDLSEVFRAAMPLENLVKAPAPVPTEVAKISPPPFSSAPPLQFDAGAPNISSDISPVIDPTRERVINSVQTLMHRDVAKVMGEKKKSSYWKGIIIFTVIAGLLFGGWFYRTKIFSIAPGFVGAYLRTYDKVMDKIKSLMPDGEDSAPSLPPVPTSPVVQAPLPLPLPPAPAPLPPRDCGTSIAPDRTKLSSFQNDLVLECLGSAALRCENATAILQDPLFPSNVQIVNKNNICSFRLAYSIDSGLIDLAGKSLAGAYISCPVSIVKMMDESNPKAVAFKAPTTGAPSIYGAQIYFYGTLGLFIENNLDINKIRAWGCTGDFIDSVISSYQATQA